MIKIVKTKNLMIVEDHLGNQRRIKKEKKQLRISFEIKPAAFIRYKT